MAREKMSLQELGLILGSRLLPGGNLHYGLWAEDESASWSGLPAAQEAYTALLLSQIPPGVATVLDVGMGTGVLAGRMLERGYRVEGVTPSRVMARLAAERLGDAVPIHLQPFQALRTERRYDLVLFAESFQYIPLPASLERAHALLNPGGHVLVADFFKTEAPGKGPVGGGHRLRRFYEALERLPFEVVLDRDITAQTAPTVTVMGQLADRFVRPVWDSGGDYLRANWPRLTRLMGWLLRRRLERIRRVYLSGRLNAGAFRRHKSYRLVLLRRPEEGAMPQVGQAAGG